MRQETQSQNNLPIVVDCDHKPEIIPTHIKDRYFSATAHPDSIR